MFARSLWFSGLVTVVVSWQPGYAQVTSDGLTQTRVSISGNNMFDVTGGTKAGQNLFHSFQEFSVPSEGAVVFRDLSDVTNIFNRVTGDSVSSIDGLIKTEEAANFFLINPNGIIFGPNASLDIGGSFLASTAKSIEFDDETSFDVDGSKTNALSISSPIGLQFGEDTAIISYDASSVEREEVLGLQVDPGKTLAMIANQIDIVQGSLIAFGGNVELVGIGEESTVGVSEHNSTWELSPVASDLLGDIKLSQEALIATSGVSSGDVYLQGRQIVIDSGSQVTLVNLPTSLLSEILEADGAINSSTGGNVTLYATDAVRIKNSGIVNSTLTDIRSGDISIDTVTFSMIGNAALDSGSGRDSTGDSGAIRIKAMNSITLDGEGGFSRIDSQTSGSGNGGLIHVETGQLTLRNGGRISSSTRGIGDGGPIFIGASKGITIEGQITLRTGNIISSGIISEAGLEGLTEEDTIGNGGLLSVSTNRLDVREGGKISVSAIGENVGQAGDLEITAQNIRLTDLDTSILAESESSKPAGDVIINSNMIELDNAARISVAGTGEGAAGILIVSSDSIKLQDQAVISAETRSEEGDIIIEGQDILLQNSSITTDALEAARGGNITITTDVLTLIDKSDITADAVGGTGGNVLINAQGVFVLLDSSITASSELNQDGIVEINTPDIVPGQGLVETGGIVTAELPEGCQVTGSTASRFINTGRRGIRPDPRELLADDQIWEDIQPPEQLSDRSGAISKTGSDTTGSQVEPYGLMLDPEGNILVLANADLGEGTIKCRRDYSRSTYQENLTPMSLTQP